MPKQKKITFAKDLPFKLSRTKPMRIKKRKNCSKGHKFNVEEVFDRHILIIFQTISAELIMVVRLVNFDYLTF